MQDCWSSNVGMMAVWGLRMFRKQTKKEAWDECTNVTILMDYKCKCLHLHMILRLRHDPCLIWLGCNISVSALHKRELAKTWEACNKKQSRLAPGKENHLQCEQSRQFVSQTTTSTRVYRSSCYEQAERVISLQTRKTHKKFVTMSSPHPFPLTVKGDAG